MLLVHKDIPHMPLTELINDSESLWIKRFVNKKTHFVASWYRPPVDGHLPVSDNGNDLLNSLEKFDNLFREQLDKIKNINKGNNPPTHTHLIYVLGNFNLRDIVWPDRLSKSGSSLSQTKGQLLTNNCNQSKVLWFILAKDGVGCENIKLHCLDTVKSDNLFYKQKSIYFFSY